MGHTSLFHFLWLLQGPRQTFFFFFFFNVSEKRMLQNVERRAGILSGVWRARGIGKAYDKQQRDADSALWLVLGRERLRLFWLVKKSGVRNRSVMLPAGATDTERGSNLSTERIRQWDRRPPGSRNDARNMMGSDNCLSG